ncbi:MAG: 4Fe-4S dicluster domain-containing protein [Bacteroidetes bacterium]|jgi:NAD-dependent dihydropyrimidine dehydrogenase PreA subunit|nr:4Fe-4S dicluster domain-containing protein [Bacteroidota bacterium]
MAHHTVKKGYSNLVDRLNKFPLGVPPSQLLYKILEMLFTEREAQQVAQLPIKPFSAAKAQKIWKLSESETRKTLNTLADHGLLVDIDRNGESVYVLPPPMAGFFEFSMMRLRKDIDQSILAELFYQYITVEEDFIKTLFTDGITQLGRTFVNETVLSEDNSLHVLDYERASEVIKTASAIGVGMCYCRHKKEHLGTACDAPMDICMTFNNTGGSLIKHGIAREVEVSEGLELLDQAYENNLVQFGENVQNKVNFICNCCGCCCEALIAARRFALMDPVHTTNFLPDVIESNCTGCGKCVEVCPVESITLISANNPAKIKQKLARVVEETCLGCGVCVRVCTKNALRLKQRPKRVITPVNGAHKAVMMAIERGKLQNLIFDNQVLWNHRALAALIGVILRLPPVKQIFASDQIKSRYIGRLMQKMEDKQTR